MRGGHAGIEMATHRADALLVGGRVEPKAAIRAEGLEQAIAVLPRAELLGRHTDPLPQGTDALVRLVHGVSLYELWTKI